MSTAEVRDDPQLRDVPEMDGFKVLDPCVLYLRLGKGGMGTVYRGRHAKLDIDVAVKCLKRSLADEDERFVDRFHREAKVAARINAPNLVRVFDVDEKNGLHFLIMEFVEGETARERVKRKGALRVEEALTIALGAARGLAAAHAAGIVHRDVKPDNSLVSKTGEVKLADLGLAKAAEAAERMTATGAVWGTPQYMPPEQWHDASRVGPAGDVYAIGVTLYFLLTGEEAIAAGPFGDVRRRVCEEDFPDVRDRVPGLAPKIAEVIGRCVEKRPERRFASAEPLVRAIEDLVPSRSEKGALDDPDTGAGTIRCTMVSPPPPGTLARIRKTLAVESGSATPAEVSSPSGPRSRRRPLVAGLGAIAVVALVLGGFWSGLLTGAGSGDAASHLTGDAARATPDSENADVGSDGAAESPVIISAPPAEEGGAVPAAKPEPSLAARALLVAATEKSRSREGLEDAIADLERALALDPSLVAARDLLALCFRRRGEVLLEEGRSADALGAADRSLATADTGLARDLRAAAVAAVEKELAAGFEVTRPEPDSVFNVARVIVSGTCRSASVREIRVNGKPALLAGERFDSEISGIPDGPLEIVVEAEESHGVVVTVRRSVLVVTALPVVAVTVPAEGAELTARVVEVSGTVQSAASASVTVNGKPAELDKGRWTASLDVTEGTVVIRVEAVDAVGNRSPAIERRHVVKLGHVTLEWADARPGTDHDPLTKLPKEITHRETGIAMVLIPAGTYRRGASDGDAEAGNDEKPAHSVEITRPFYLGKYEVTNEEYRRFEKDHDSGSLGSSLNGANQPVVNVSWMEAKAFCDRFGLRLPTEAEWEYACRAGTSTRYPWDGDVGSGPANANWSGDDDGFPVTSDVGRFRANGFGLHDMIGNVWEWCSDRYGEKEYGRFSNVGAVDPTGPAQGEWRVLRGGSWIDLPGFCRSSYRRRLALSIRNVYFGFRVARTP